ncbi:heavy metal translocating P-type ATPase metal-binding domain-containing protein [Flavobacteriaceae bacterium F08102]|nr:heavy metal translocating P-type ATPase metal-binding domain-containing protein [Flavobacteriaceae bacterium F08102]
MTGESCFHCGNPCDSNPIRYNDKFFCCQGCKVVYDILQDNDLTTYYELSSSPGKRPDTAQTNFNYLDNKEIFEKLLDFQDESTSIITLYIPHIHCSSCIWVLENLHQLAPAVSATQVNFPKKELQVTFRHNELSLRALVELLARIGYEPYISLDDEQKKPVSINRTLWLKMGVAGFAFGNIMMLSFPEYFESDEYWLNQYTPLFRMLIFLTSLPVVFYAANDYIISAYKGLRKSILNIDVPIVLGIFVLFFKSTYEVFIKNEPGYFDSLAGFVFFLLLGRIFQQRTYQFLSFERDYKSYFPLAVTRILDNEQEESVLIKELKKNDRILIRHQELIPVDAVLSKGVGLIDYSFVTGESIPVSKMIGDKVYAGGKQVGGAVELVVVKTVSQSYLSQLWNNDVFKKDKVSDIKNLTDAISKRFTMIVLAIAFLAGIFWYFKDSTMVATVVTSVLIVACPCALALSAPFALGNMLRIYGRRKMYLKSAEVVENLAHIDTVIFDKTGTLTTQETEIYYEGKPMTPAELNGVKGLLHSSNHPLSRMLYTYLDTSKVDSIDEFEEVLGSGLQGRWKGVNIRLGSASFVGVEPTGSLKTQLYVAINNQVKGCYTFQSEYRKNLKDTFNALAKNYRIGVLSGDNEGSLGYLKTILPKETAFVFNQKPEDKLNYIKELQEKGLKVLMIGDGLNDAGALAQSDVGFAMAENVNVFSPASDGIIDAESFQKIPAMLNQAKRTLRIVKISFVLSLAYNLIGMGFALTGNLSPIVSAILMPLSSISIVIFVTLATYWIARKP